MRIRVVVSAQSVNLIKMAQFREVPSAKLLSKCANSIIELKSLFLSFYERTANFPFKKI